MLKVVGGAEAGQESGTLALGLDELAREGARRMLMAALEEEVEAYLSCHSELRDEKGHAVVVRNGRARPRKVTTGAGTLDVSAPRVNDRRAEKRFSSKILPPYMRRSPKVAEALPILYLRGLSTGDFQEALKGLLGEDAAGLSAANITRLLGVWEAEHEAFRKRDLSGVDYVYVWVDGIHVNVRLGEQDRVCLLVMLGVRPDGTKELIAVEDGYRESAESWADVLRDLKRRGMQAPVLAIGDGALGFWAAVRDVWPETREQRCWVHRLANVLDKLPKRLQGTAKQALSEIMNAPTRARAKEEIARFESDYGAKYPKAIASLRRDEEALLAFYDFPAEHWVHVRTTNPIESSFATVRLRQRVTKGPGSRKRGLLMAFKLLDMAGKRWRRLTAAHLLPLVRAEVQFPDGKQLERDEDNTDEETPERAAA
jgi:transposase-like protein